MQRAIIFGAPTANHEAVEIARITNLCEQFHCLPQEGGLFDQDAYLVLGMNLVNEVRAQKVKKDADQANAEAEARKKK